MSGLAINPNGVQFNADSDISDLTGKIILVTGGTLEDRAARAELWEWTQKELEGYPVSDIE